MNPIHEKWKLNFPNIPRDRCTGRSTRFALRIIVSAMENHGRWIPIRDHFDTWQADEHLMRMINEYLDRLGFNTFEVKRDGNTFWLMFGAPDE